MVSKDILSEKYLGKGQSIRNIANDIGVSCSTVQKYLKKYNIKIRTKSQSRQLYFKKNETVDSSFFKVMSLELAYIIGLWLTDGCAYERGSFSLGLKDKDVIEWVAKTIGYKNKIWELEEQRNHSKRYYIQFTNQVVKDIFDKYGVIPNKSLITKVPDIPKEFIPHFIRGVFEGDGHIGKHGYSYTLNIVSASHEFISKLKDIIEEEIGGNRSIKYDGRGNGLYLYNIYGKETINNFGNWIYPPGVFGMERKLNKFLELKEAL